MGKDFFDSWVRFEVERRGTRGLMPVFYDDITSMTGVFTAESERIRELLPHAAMHPLEMTPGRALVAITAFEYRHCDLAPYNEVSIAFLISFGARPIPGLSAARAMLSRVVPVYVWQLPVTTEEARAGGVDIFGYPKFVAAIDFARDDDWIACTLGEGGQEILQLKGPRLKTNRGKPLHYVTYTMAEGRPLVADVLVNPIAYAEAYGSSGAAVRLGTGHVVSDTLGQLGLSARSAIYQYSPLNEAILFPPRNVLGAEAVQLRRSDPLAVSG